MDSIISHEQISASGGGWGSAIKGSSQGLYLGMAAVSASMETSLTFAELIRDELDKQGKDFNEKNIKK